jgi:hypothetical protein
LKRLLRRHVNNPVRAARALVKDLSEYGAALWTFAKVEGLEPTNNAAERAIRKAVLWRKGSFGSIEAQALWGGAAVGIVLGLFVGKPIGVVTFAWLAVKLGVANLPREVNWRGIQGVGVLAGIGFTMSLFIAGLAFSADLAQVAKLAIFVASLLSGVVGWWLVKRAAE